MDGPAAFLDACALVPIATCDTMLRMADAGAFQPLWSARVIEEALRALSRIHSSVEPNRLQNRFTSMNQAFRHALVSGWEPLEASIRLPDPDDRHVVAAALRGRADVVVTENVRDFPHSMLSRLGLEAIRVDDFLLRLLEDHPKTTRHVLAEQATALSNPRVSTSELLLMLERAGAPAFAAAVRSSDQDSLASIRCRVE